MKKIIIFLISSFLVLFSSAKAADTIKLGILEDETGNFAIAVVPKIHAYELAVKEINAAGGVLGKKQLSKLKIYSGDNHPHTAQNPKVIEIGKLNNKNIVRN